MLKSIKHFFDTQLAPDAKAVKRNPQHAIRLAVAALLTEVIESDYENSPQERDAMLAIVRDHFGLEPQEASELVSLAAAAHAESTDYFQFTRLINKSYNQRQKIRVIEDLWRVAYADDKLDKYEEYQLRKIADLLYIPHSIFIQTKLKVTEA